MLCYAAKKTETSIDTLNRLQQKNINLLEEPQTLYTHLTNVLCAHRKFYRRMICQHWNVLECSIAPTFDIPTTLNSPPDHVFLTRNFVLHISINYMKHIWIPVQLPFRSHFLVSNGLFLFYSNDSFFFLSCSRSRSLSLILCIWYKM